MPTYFPAMSPAEMQTLQKMVFSAIRSLEHHDERRILHGRLPENASRIAFLQAIAEKLKT